MTIPASTPAPPKSTGDTYRAWLETTPYMRDEVRCFDAPNSDDRAAGIWGVECRTCLRATYYRHAGSMTHEEATALTMHLRSHEEEPEDRDDDGPCEAAPEPRESFPGHEPQIADVMRRPC